MKYKIKYNFNKNIYGGSDTILKQYCESLSNNYISKYGKNNVELYSSDISTKGCIFKINENGISKIIKIISNNDYYYFYQTYEKIKNNNILKSIHPEIFHLRKIKLGDMFFYEIIMEYFGESLKEYQIQLAEPWLKQTLETLHKNGIVHGDILSELSSLEISKGRYRINLNNILINNKNEFKLIDFDPTFNGKFLENENKNYYEESLKREKYLFNKYFNEVREPARPTKKKKPNNYDDDDMLFEYNDNAYLFSDSNNSVSIKPKKLF